MSEPRWEVFKKGSGPQWTVPAVTISSRGYFKPNVAAFELMGSPRRVETLWEADQQIIGLRPTNDDSGYRISVVSGMTAVAFLRHIKVQFDQAYRWEVYLEHGVLCIPIGTPGHPITSNHLRHGETDG